MKSYKAHTSKTRSQIAAEYGICRKTLYNWLKKEGIQLRQGLITPKELARIYAVLGNPGHFTYSSFTS